MIGSNGQARNSLTTPIRKKIGNYSYATQDQLGSGYSSQVFLGTDDSNSRPVALKVLPLAITRSKGLEGLLVQEIQLLREISHDNVIRCLQVLMTTNNCYIVTELCQDGDLASLLTRKGKLPVSEALPLALQIAKGLAYLHSLHILHRDVKPQNILLSGAMAKIADLGFAVRSEQPTVEKYSIGTPLYMSPQALQLKQYSQKNDVWALGVTLYEMMEGRPPWNAPNEKELKQSIKGQLRFRNVRCCELQHLIKGCLAYESIERLQANQVVEKLQAMLRIQQGSENKQNQLRGNQTEPEPETEQLKRSMRSNYDILKWLVNYSRFAAKLLPKLQHLTCSQLEQQPFVELAARALHLAISKLNRVDQLHSQLDLKHYPHFRRTTRFSKIQAVAKEYHNKYLLLLTKLPFKYTHPSTLALPWPLQLTQHLETLSIHAECEQNHLVAIQELLTLIEVNHKAHTTNPHSLAHSIDFDQLLAVPTPQPNLEALIARRQTILLALNSSQQ